MAPFSICTTQRPDYGRVEQLGDTKAMRFFWTQTGYNGTRMRRGAEACSNIPFYKEGWYGLKFWLPSQGFPMDKHEIIAQLFQMGGCSSWAGTLAIIDNSLWVDHRGGCGVATHALIASDIKRDAWNSIVIHFVVSKARAGKIEVWYNGAPQETPTYRAININFAASSSLFTADDELQQVPRNNVGLKFGMYNYDEGNYTPNETRTIYYDDVSQLVGNPPDAFSRVSPVSVR